MSEGSGGTQHTLQEAQGHHRNPTCAKDLFGSVYASEVENTNTRVCRALLALHVTQAALSSLPRQAQAPLDQQKRFALLQAHGLELLFPRSM